MFKTGKKKEKKKPFIINIFDFTGLNLSKQ